MTLQTPLRSRDVVIVGGGAAGLAAAIFTAQSLSPGSESPKITVVDGARKLGAKILVSGGGRCNITHQKVSESDYSSSSQGVRRILRAFDHGQAQKWFHSLGVPLKTEPTGKLFPVTNSARTVLNALLTRCEELGVEILTHHRVESLTASPNAAFHLETSGGPLECKAVVLATGGQSLPKSGSDGQGYSLARRLGHSILDTRAALVPLMLDGSFFHSDLSGVAHPVTLSVWVGGKQVERRAGDMLWTHFGISGPVAMDISGTWVRRQSQGDKPQLYINLSQSTFEDLEKELIAANTAHTNRPVGRHLQERLPKGVVNALLGHLGLSPTLPLGELQKGDRRKLVHGLTHLPLPALKHRGWNHAEVTSGGVPLDEINLGSTESKVVPNLFLVGEILDCDGRIGGFNFQWAWATGFVAGRALGKRL